MFGVGVWVEHSADGLRQVESLLAPAPFVASQFKAVGWRMTERTYRTWTQYQAEAQASSSRTV